MYSLKGENSTKLYLDALKDLVKDGDECSPRGKLIKELRPASVEFTNPYNRITFLGSRRVNPFFMIAESLWIISGKADVQWLTKFNANMSQFSDDGVWFNAPYGERIRSYGKNALHNVIVNPVDQLVDAYTKLLSDKDTRQAVMVISHPHFDNAKYTIGEKGKDIACLTGDTMIASPEGDLPIKELVKLDSYPVYSFNESTSTVEIKEMVAGGLTRRNAKVMKITMGDGTELKATPDHKFYVKRYKTNMAISSNGFKYPVNSFVGYEQVNAEDLEVGDRLPFLLRYEEEQGYINLNLHTLSKSISEGTKEHIMYSEYLLGRPLKENEIVHHKNHKRNCNSRDNLEVLDKSYHDSLDMKDNKIPAGLSKKRTDSTLLTKENLFNTAVSIIESGKVLSKKSFQEAFEGVGCLAACNKHYGTFKSLKELAYSSLGLLVPNGMSGSNGNIKSTTIVKIEYLDEVEDVYDITVDGNHNFFANGYLVHNCNLVVTFKIRHDKLNMTVFNRSNDANWGLWGANLCQFTTIQEVMLSWLKYSGKEEFADLEIGTYCQVTDSLHIYLDDYGAKCTTDVLEYYKTHSEDEVLADFNCVNEPRMSLSAMKFDQFLATYWSALDPYIMDDEYLSNTDNVETLLKLLGDLHNHGIVDDYWYFGIKAMIVYRLVKLDKVSQALLIVKSMTDCQWKISMMYFLKSFVYKVGKDVDRTEEYNEILENWDDIVFSLSNSLKNENSREQLVSYLKL